MREIDFMCMLNNKGHNYNQFMSTMKGEWIRYRALYSDLKFLAIILMLIATQLASYMLSRKRIVI